MNFVIYLIVVLIGATVNHFMKGNAKVYLLGFLVGYACQYIISVG